MNNKAPHKSEALESLAEVQVESGYRHRLSGYVYAAR